MSRVISTILGLPLVLALIAFGNKYLVDIIIALIALISIYEYFNAISKVCKPCKIIGYIACISIALIHIIPQELLMSYITLMISSVFLVLFLKVIVTNMKTDLKDVVFTFFGIIYIVFFSIFISMTYSLENGKFLILYVLIAAWGTDIFAFLVGRPFGKHKFSKVSPKKSIEGCIGGIIGATLVAIIYTFFISKYMQINYSYIYIIIITIILSIIGQVGDFIASSIKRYVNIKDYGDLIPGHGGMLDRIDSLLFLSPFAYIFLSFVI